VKNIGAGSLRHMVTLKRSSNSTPAAMVDVPPANATVGVFHALVECVSGAEATNSGQLKGILKYRVTLRASAGPIRPSDLITYNGISINVVDAEPDPFGIFILVNGISKGQQ
jgi:hypothetical protein